MWKPAGAVCELMRGHPCFRSSRFRSWLSVFVYHLRCWPVPVRFQQPAAAAGGRGL